MTDLPNDISFLRADVCPDPLTDNAPFIPRVIWQTMRDTAEMSPPIAHCVTQLRALHPDWQHILLDDAGQRAFLQARCSDRFMRAYDRIQPRYGAARADLFRYVAIYLHGGVYLDIKSGVDRPLDQILRPDDRFVLSQWSTEFGEPDGYANPHADLRHIGGGEYQQWMIIAAPGHPFLAAVIEQVLNNIEDYNPFRWGIGPKAVLKVVGPVAYTLAIHPMLGQHPFRKIVAAQEGIRYTMLPDPFAHQGVDKRHYAKVKLPVITTKGLRGGARLRLALWTALYWPKLVLSNANRRRKARHA